MKHSHFKIRKMDYQTQFNKEKSEPDYSARKVQQFDSLRESIQQTNEKMVEILSLFETFMKTSLQHSAAPSQPQPYPQPNLGAFAANKIENEVRDRYTYLPLPSSDKLLKEDAQKWMTQVCSIAFSTSFHYYLTEQMTFQQTKVFCSQNILRNMLLLTEKFKLTGKQLENLNKHVGGKILEYLQKKYPLTQSNDINKALQKEIHQTNHLDLLTNDFLYNSGIMFKYSEDGNYNDMIMRVINKVIQMAESTSLFSVQKEDNKRVQESNYSDFERFMSDLFDHVYDQQWMVGHKTKAARVDTQATHIAKRVNSQFQKEKYEQKVRSYTNYLIGRKISQNTLPYTEEQISSKNLKIKSPAILRILTKWCEQLWQKFENQTYFTEMTQSIQLQDPQRINPFFKWMKTSIDRLVSQEKINILAFKAEIDRNSYNQQSEFLLRHLEQDNVTSIPKYEKATGKFASHMVKNLHSYITLYLNRLIHGLLTVSKEFHTKQIDKSWDDWQAPPNLITFKIGDLIRCKISSKEKQIVKIFKEIKRLSNTNSQKLKIVRIKNRLKQGTNDILMNIKFNNLIICEIQLQVINKSKTKFTQCSNSFSHYIYEMRRSIFGPIFELCNIWSNFEARSSQYELLIKKSNEGKKFSHQCSQNEHNYAKFDLPFQCNQCSKLYYHNNYIISNKKCSKCQKYKCVKCQINNMDQNELKKLIFTARKDQKIAKSIARYESTGIPSKGVCVKIQSTLINIETFQYTKYEGKNRILGIKDGQVYQILKVKTPKDTEIFLEKYCVFELIVNPTNFININEKVTQKFTIEAYLRQAYKQEKQVLILTQLRYKVQEMVELMKVDGGFDRGKKKIKRLQFASNYIDNIEYFQCFQNLTSINLDYNLFMDLSQLCKFKNLQKLQISENSSLYTFNAEVCELEKLQEIKMNNTKIVKLPEQIGKLVNLTSIKMDKNQVSLLPQSFCHLVNLQELSMRHNSLQSLPEKFGDLKNLRKLALKKNRMNSLPQSFGQLSNLQLLDLSMNALTSLPPNIMYLSKLETLRLQQNQFESLPQSLLPTEALKIFTLSQNKLKSLPNFFGACKNLTTLTIHKNQIAQLPQSLKHCVLLSELTLYQNKLNEIPQWFNVFTKLPPIVDLQKNCLKVFPKYVFQLEGVTKINLLQNEITVIPDQISKMQQLKLLILTKNKVKQLNPGLVQMHSQFSLQIGYNQIQEIPPYVTEIGEIKKKPYDWSTYFKHNKVKVIQHKELLDAMDINIIFTNNLLEIIPIDLMVNKEKILSLNFNDNKIKQIPRDIKLFINLVKLFLRNNLIEVIPEEVASLTKIVKSGLQFNDNPIREVQCLPFCKNLAGYLTLGLLKELFPEENKPMDQNKSKEASDAND